MPQVLILADDLTGAADTGLPFQARGLRVRVHLAGGSDARLDDAANDTADVAVLSIETRSLPLAEAQRQTRHAAERIAPFIGSVPASVVYKKIDSTLRGWVGPETRLLLEALPDYCAWIVPAYPEQGRTMTNGIYRVHGAPLHETVFASELPGGGLTDSFLPSWLERQIGAPVGFVSARVVDAGVAAIVRAARHHRRAGRRVLVFDAADGAQIRRVVAAGQGSGKPLLWVGSAGLGRGVAEMVAGSSDGDAGSPAVPRPGAATVVVVAGSRNPVTRAQVARLLRARGDDDTVLVTPGEADAGDDARVVADRLGARAADRIRQAPPGGAALVLTGGDTAAAVLRHLGASALDILGAVEEAMPISRIVGGAANGALAVTKAGGFGAETSLLAAVAALRRGDSPA